MDNDPNALRSSIACWAVLMVEAIIPTFFAPNDGDIPNGAIFSFARDN
jgi:hypothetical protein